MNDDASSKSGIDRSHASERTITKEELLLNQRFDRRNLLVAYCGGSLGWSVINRAARHLEPAP